MGENHRTLLRLAFSPTRCMLPGTSVTEEGWDLRGCCGSGCCGVFAMAYGTNMELLEILASPVVV